MRDEDCLTHLRKIIVPIPSIPIQAAIIEKSGFGNCEEAARLSAYKIGRALNDLNINALIKVVYSFEPFEHVFVIVDIWLESELEISSWEVDAWNPNVTDLFNDEYRIHKNYITKEAFHSCKMDTQEYEVDFIKAVEGPPSKCPTPVEEMPIKHPEPVLFSTIPSLEEATKKGALSLAGKIHLPQEYKFNKLARLAKASLSMQMHFIQMQLQLYLNNQNLLIHIQQMQLDSMNQKMNQNMVLNNKERKNEKKEEYKKNYTDTNINGITMFGTEILGTRQSNTRDNSSEPKIKKVIQEDPNKRAGRRLLKNKVNLPKNEVEEVGIDKVETSLRANYSHSRY